MKKLQNVCKGFTVAYFLNAFPKLSETFVLNEILQLKKRGINVLIYSLFRANEGIGHKRAVPLLDNTIYVCDIGKKSKLQSLLILCLTHPLKLIKTAAYVRSMNDKSMNWYLKQAIYLGGELSRLGIHHIHAHFALEAADHALLVHMLTGIPYSFAAHAVDIYAYQRMLREKMNYAKFVVTECEYNKSYLLGYNKGFPEGRIHVIRLAVDLDTFSAKEKRAGQKKLRDCFHIVSVARLVEKKGLKYLIEALGTLRQDGMEFQATIVGDGPDQRILTDLIHRHKLESTVQLEGAKDAEAVKTLLCDADVFVLPCIIADNGDRDATPTVLFEAMAIEIPVISTTVAGIPEIVPQKAGILVPPRDSTALAKAVKIIFHMDSSEKKAMGAYGREHVVSHCNTEKETKKLVSLFLADN